ncbi:UDP-N-acetylmuramate--L-alanine ligase [bacterium HR11]|nr:UDP-N-acetylmuramate--L-alanine ligase [bacterium HR11]
MFVPKPTCIHMVGIGGTGMSGIAELLLNMGYRVQGSDLAASPVLERLERFGARVFIGHRPEHVEGADVVVISSAIRDDNPEVLEARRRGIPVIHRVEMLTELMRLKQGIAIAGAHGKTTTTSMIGMVLADAGLDPTMVIGGRLKALGTNAYLGKGSWIVVESDESDGSFLRLTPIIAVVTNIDREHLDRYGHFDALKDAFVQFCNQVPFYGAAIVCLEDPQVQSILFRLKRRVITYGLNPQSHYWADDVRLDGWQVHFRVHGEGEDRALRLSIPGAHNVLNALAAVATARFIGIPWDRIEESLARFTGVERRFQLKAQVDDVWVVDDYAHHPTEIVRTLETARGFHRRLVVVFQPHRYSRVSFLWDDFARCFYLADVLLVLPIYPAGEDPIPGVDAERLAEDIHQSGHRAVTYCDSLEQAVEVLVSTVQPGDLVLTLGAGHVYRVGEALARRLEGGRLDV